VVDEKAGVSGSGVLVSLENADSDDSVPMPGGCCTLSVTVEV
jgi:hypothetical protein